MYLTVLCGTCDRYRDGFVHSQQAAVCRRHSRQLRLSHKDGWRCHESLCQSVVGRQWHSVELSISRPDSVSGRPKLALLSHRRRTAVSFWLNLNQQCWFNVFCSNLSIVTCAFTVVAAVFSEVLELEPVSLVIKKRILRLIWSPEPQYIADWVKRCMVILVIGTSWRRLLMRPVGIVSSCQVMS